MKLISRECERVISDELKEELYYLMVLIRLFEQRVLELFSRGLLFGTAHCCIGQEAGAVAVIGNLQENDIIVSNHRCHGHYLARTEDVQGLMAELMGRVGGVCGGRGGSQHLCKGNFYTNGIQGNMVPVAAGMALAQKKKGTDSIVVLFIGDGTFGQGVVYETLNMISLWRLPVLIVVENNRYAQTTPVTMNFAGTFSARAEAFGLSVGETDTDDVIRLKNRFADIIKTVRTQSCPHVEVIHTYRFCAHSKGDDYRPSEEIEFWRAKDPLKKLEEQIPVELQLKLTERAAAKIEQAVIKAENMPFANLSENS
jgi:TPP-dependent pyruvate/acetoin dehydrogenase alpha subunit